MAISSQKNTNLNSGTSSSGGISSSGVANWRHQLQVNEHRTQMVIAMFIAIYLVVGLFIDVYLHPELSKLPLTQVLMLFVRFQVNPTATLVMGLVALVSIIVAYSLHDKIMLLGTEYREITKDNAKSLADRQIYNVVEELKIAAGLRYMPKIYVIEADYMNAFASGYSEQSALIAITRGLIEKLERDELQAVIAHELTHIRHHDIKLTLMASVLSNIMLIAIDFLFYSMLFSDRRRRDEEGDNRLFLVVIIMRYLLPLLTMLLLLYLSRTREYMADAGAVELTREHTALAKALIKISGDHEDNKEKYAALYGGTSHENVRLAAYIFDPGEAGIKLQQSIAGVFSTHPSLKSRLKALGFKQG